MPGTVPDVQSQDGILQSDVNDYAVAALRAKNCKEFKSTITCAGLLSFPNGVAVQSGIVVEFKNKGIFDGNWIIEKQTLHIVDGKFVTEIEFRKCIQAIEGTTIEYVPLT